MELVIIEERTKNIKTKGSVMSSCNRISDSESDESVGGIQRRVSGVPRNFVQGGRGFNKFS